MNKQGSTGQPHKRRPDITVGEWMGSKVSSRCQGRPQSQHAPDSAFWSVLVHGHMHKFRRGDAHFTLARPPYHPTMFALKVLKHTSDMLQENNPSTPWHMSVVKYVSLRSFSDFWMNFPAPNSQGSAVLLFR